LSDDQDREITYKYLSCNIWVRWQLHMCTNGFQKEMNPYNKVQYPRAAPKVLWKASGL
jgi:hypothetical protein